MKRITIRSLSVLLALLIALTLSVCALADGESSDTAEESSAAESSTEESSAEESSAAESEAESKTAESSAAEASSEAESSAAESSAAAADEAETASSFPWARVITLIVIVALIVAAIILSKTQTALGQKIAKFFRDYKSEVQKIVWFSFKDTMKATGVVLVTILIFAVVIGLLDFGFTEIIKLLANITK